MTKISVVEGFPLRRRIAIQYCSNPAQPTNLKSTNKNPWITYPAEPVSFTPDNFIKAWPF